MAIAVTPFDFPLSMPHLTIVGFAFRILDPWKPPHDLPHQLRQAVPKRQAEFVAGRKAAAAACRLLGIEASNLPIGLDRRPVWPPDTVGSISHSDSLAVAVIARRAACAGVGIDVERLREEPVTDYLVPGTVSEAEITLLRDHFGREQAALLLFSAREAVFKAISPMLKERPDFHDFQCTGIDSGWLSFRFLDRSGTNPDLPRRMDVRFAIAADHICTLCALPQSSHPR